MLLLDLRGTGLRAGISWLDEGRFRLDVARIRDGEEVRLLVDWDRFWFRELEPTDAAGPEPARAAHRLGALTSFLAERLEPRPMAAVARDQYALDELSPDGRSRLILDCEHGRMSHVMWVPRLYDAATGKELFRAPDPGFDATTCWLDGGRLRLSLIHYTLAGTGTVTIDPAARSFRFEQPFAGPDEPLSSLGARLDEEFRRQDTAARGGVTRPRPPIPPSRATLAMRWILAIGGVALFYAIIVGIAFGRRG
jgi:hypothetical protein